MYKYVCVYNIRWTEQVVFTYLHIVCTHKCIQTHITIKTKEKEAMILTQYKGGEMRGVGGREEMKGETNVIILQLLKY